MKYFVFYNKINCLRDIYFIKYSLKYKKIWIKYLYRAVEGINEAGVGSIEVDGLSGCGHHQCLLLAEDNVLRLVSPRPRWRLHVLDGAAQAEQALFVHAEAVVLVAAPNPQGTVRTDDRAAIRTCPQTHRVALNAAHLQRTKSLPKLRSIVKSKESNNWRTLLLCAP